MAVTAGRIFHSLLPSAKLGKQSHCLLKRQECVVETNVFPLGFLGVEISLVLSGLPVVVSVHRTPLPNIPVGCALADPRVISALESHSHLSFLPRIGWRSLMLFGCSKSHIPQLRHFHVKPNRLAACSQ